MSPYFRVLRTGLVGLTILGVIEAVERSWRRAERHGRGDRAFVWRTLERLPYYGVFDYIVFRVNRGTVYLAGYGFQGRLKADAEMAAKRASGWLLIFYKRQRHEGRRGDASHFLSVTAWWRAFDAPLEWLAPPAHICRAYVDPERGRRMTPAARQAGAARSRISRSHLRAGTSLILETARNRAVGLEIGHSGDRRRQMSTFDVQSIEIAAPFLVAFRYIADPANLPGLDARVQAGVGGPCLDGNACGRCPDRVTGSSVGAARHHRLDDHVSGWWHRNSRVACDSSR